MNEQKLKSLEHLQQYNAAGTAEDRAQQEFAIHALMQFYGLQHEQQLLPGQLQGQQLENQTRQQGLDFGPSMNAAKLAELQAITDYSRAHAGYEDQAAKEFTEGKHSREFQQQGSTYDRMYPPGHPMRDQLMNQLMEQYYPGSTKSSVPVVQPQGAYGPGSVSNGIDPYTNDPEFKQYNDIIAKGQLTDQRNAQQNERTKALDDRRRAAQKYTPQTYNPVWAMGLD